MILKKYLLSEKNNADNKDGFGVGFALNYM